MDIDHIDTGSRVYGYSGEPQLASCLDGAEVVVIAAGIPRKPGIIKLILKKIIKGMDRKDLFNINAGIITKIVDQICKSTFNPLIAIISNPVNIE